jgi:hypothetical protein
MGREIRRVPANWQHPETENRYGEMRLTPNSVKANEREEGMSEAPEKIRTNAAGNAIVTPHPVVRS